MGTQYCIVEKGFLNNNGRMFEMLVGLPGIDIVSLL